MSTLPFKSKEEYGKEIRKLGEGTYGKVMMTDQSFAVKTISIDIDEIIDQTALQEIVFLNKISSPYLIPLIDVIIDSYEQKLILPLADNVLSRLMASALLDVKSLSRQLCLGLADIHNADLLHLDLKPDNILIYGIKKNYANAKLWIADLGISKIHTCASLPLQGTFFSKWYRPPETFLHEPTTTKSDIWALGIIIAEILISQKLRQRAFLLFGESDHQIVHNIFNIMGSPSSTSRLRLSKLWNEEMGNYENKFHDKMKKLKLSDADLEFIEFILRVDPDERPDIWEILQHPWLELDKDKIPVKLNCRQRLELYSHYPNYCWERIEDRNTFIQYLIHLTGFVKTSNKSLSLSIYLFDRLVALRGTFKGLRAHIIAIHYLATTFYEESSYYDYIPIILQLELTKQVVREAMISVLRETCFDLTTATSYLFLLHHFKGKKEVKAEIAINIWNSSLYTMTHFEEPSLVADAIIAIINKDYHANKLSVRLLDEIMSLSDDLPLEYGRHGVKTKVKDAKDKIKEFLTTD